MDQSIEKTLVATLAAKGLHIATAESCTGGLAAARITSVAGASEVFDGAVVSYANRVKEELLGVPEKILARHGAVSAECACAMAQGVRTLMGADIGVSLTGIAGPGGGTPEKPVGTVYLGIADAAGVSARLLTLSGDRDAIRARSVQAALAAALTQAEQYPARPEET